MITPLSVLIVEDLDSPRLIVEQYVHSLGYENVEAAASGAEALKMLQSEPGKFFCVIADIRMPKMTGIELTTLIRKDDRISHIPVIILTAEPTDERLRECVFAGATGFLAKPPRKEDLKAELDNARATILSGASPRFMEAEDIEKLELSLFSRRLRRPHSRVD